MASSKTWRIKLIKNSPIKLNDESVKIQVRRIAKAVERNQQHKLEAKIPRAFPEPVETEGKFRYEVIVGVHKSRIHKIEAAESQFLDAVERVRTKASDAGWEVVNLEYGEETAPTREEIRQVLDFELPEIDDQIMDTYFGRIFEREPHINIIHQSALTAISTSFEKRRHVLLYGLPACAKSEVLEAFKKWYNEVDGREHVMSLDITTTTKAGIERLLLTRAQDGDLPPFLLLEEIEKHDPKTLLSLLGVMDSRARIQRTNAREGNVIATTKIVIWATCNDKDKLEKFEGGALLSRFNHKLYCARPSEDLMKKILLREAKEMSVDHSKIENVIEKVLAFGFLEKRTTDPREFISLLDGWENIDDYLEQHRKILQAMKDENSIEVDSLNKLIDKLEPSMS